MGHLINPIIFRVGRSRMWESSWGFFTKDAYKVSYIEDFRLLYYMRWFFYFFWFNVCAGKLEFLNPLVLKDALIVESYFINFFYLNFINFFRNKLLYIFSYLKYTSFNKNTDISVSQWFEFLLFFLRTDQDKLLKQFQYYYKQVTIKNNFLKKIIFKFFTNSDFLKKFKSNIQKQKIVGFSHFQYFRIYLYLKYGNLKAKALIKKIGVFKRNSFFYYPNKKGEYFFFLDLMYFFNMNVMIPFWLFLKNQLHTSFFLYKQFFKKAKLLSNKNSYGFINSAKLGAHTPLPLEFTLLRNYGHLLVSVGIQHGFGIHPQIKKLMFSLAKKMFVFPKQESVKLRQKELKLYNYVGYSKFGEIFRKFFTLLFYNKSVKNLKYTLFSRSKYKHLRVSLRNQVLFIWLARMRLLSYLTLRKANRIFIKEKNFILNLKAPQAVVGIRRGHRAISRLDPRNYKTKSEFLKNREKIKKQNKNERLFMKLSLKINKKLFLMKELVNNFHFFIKPYNLLKSSKSILFNAIKLLFKKHKKRKYYVKVDTRSKLFVKFISAFFYFLFRMFYWTRISSLLSKKLSGICGSIVLVVFFSMGPEAISARLVSSHIAAKLKLKYKLGSIIYPVINYLKRIRQLDGFKLMCCGRFTRKQRATFLVRTRGSLSFSSVSSLLDYNLSVVFLRFGACGIKVWLSFKKNTLNDSDVFLFESMVSRLSNSRFFFSRTINFFNKNVLFPFIKKFKQYKSFFFFKYKQQSKFLKKYISLTINKHKNIKNIVKELIFLCGPVSWYLLKLS